MNLSKNNSRFSLRNILISSFVILFFVFIINTYYSMLYKVTREKIIKGNELSSVTSAEKISTYLSRGVDTLTLGCFTLDNMILSGSPQSKIRDYLVNQSAAIVSTTGENSTGIYAYINGEYLDGTGWEPDESFVPTQRPWYLEAQVSGGRVAVVGPYPDAETGTNMITFSKILCDGTSVAATDFLTDRLQAITEQIAAQEELDSEIVLDQRYQVIAHSNPSEVGKNYLEDDGRLGAALVKELLSAGESSVSLKFNGQKYLVYAVPVSNDWQCLSVFNATEEFRQMRSAVIYTIVISFAVVIILLVILDRSSRRQEQTFRLRNVVEALAAAIDAKDAYTNGHSARVAEYAREISRRYGYSKKRQGEIYMMGLLHDVGKIGIPDTVIKKPGKLTDEEFKIIKTHPVIGWQMLTRAAELSKMAVGARWHHEHYDGSGYPDGLAGNDILEEARIIAVADAYDAMTSDRSYRDLLPQEVVRQQIQDGKGTQFDPVFADLMLQLIDEDKDYRMHGQ